uniref:cullin-RING-type E3 NEDD8 transferase n=1 Tax=Chrysemys picta bellii TaxID=8478 RepID=A0A8C3F600_CHRPI
MGLVLTGRFPGGSFTHSGSSAALKDPPLKCRRKPEAKLYSEHQIEFCSCLLLDACLRCQAENKQEDCVVVWGECNHSFHNCCMSLWVKQNNRCPLCQQDWVVQRIGK